MVMVSMNSYRYFKILAGKMKISFAKIKPTVKAFRLFCTPAKLNNSFASEVFLFLCYY